MAPAKITSLSSFPPVSHSTSRPSYLNLLPRHTPISPIFSSLLCSTCSTLRLSLLRNGYAQTTIASRTEVLHSATVCRMCRLILKGVENRFRWMEKCSVDSIDPFGPGKGEQKPKIKNDDAERYSKKANTPSGDSRCKMDSCALLRGATIHIRAQTSPSDVSSNAPLGITSSEGILANVDGLGIEVVVFGNASVDELPEENLCVWHSSERARRAEENKLNKRPGTAASEVCPCESEDEFHDAKAPTPPPKDSFASAGESKHSRRQLAATPRTISPIKLHRNAVFHSARRWLLEISQGQSAPQSTSPESTDGTSYLPTLSRGFPSFLVDVSYPPRLVLVRTSSIVSERGRIPKYAALSHCSEIKLGVGLDDGICLKKWPRPAIDPEKDSKAVNWSALPPLIQHAALATRALKLRYMWVREMCPSAYGHFDSRNNSDDSSPAFVHIHSFVTLAVHSPSAISGFLGEEVGGFLDNRSSSRLSYSDFAVSADIESRLGSTALGLVARITSANILHFTPGRIYFEDAGGIQSPAVDGVKLRNLGPGIVNTFQIGWDEVEKRLFDRLSRRSQGLVPASFGGRSGGTAGIATSSEWFDLLERFSACPSRENGVDRLQVLESLMQLTGMDNEGSLLFGVWAGSTAGFVDSASGAQPNTNLAKGLLWRSTVQPARKTEDGVADSLGLSKADVTFPTWSWACVSNPVSFPDLVLMGHGHKGEVWLLGADSGDSKLSIGLEDAKGMLNDRSEKREIAPRVDSVGSQRLDSSVTTTPMCSTPVRGLTFQANLPMPFATASEHHGRRLILAGLLIPVRLSRSCFGKEWLKIDRADGSSKDQADVAASASRPIFPRSRSSQLASIKTSDFRRGPMFEVSEFPSYLHAPNRTAYRAIHATTRATPEGPKSELLIGWCVLDNEIGAEMDHQFVRDSENQDGYPEMAVLHLTAGYGLLLQRQRHIATSAKRPTMQSYTLICGASETGEGGKDRLRSGNDAIDGRCMYSRLAAGRMGRSLSLARMRDEMEQRRREKDAQIQTQFRVEPNSINTTIPHRVSPGSSGFLAEKTGSNEAERGDDVMGSETFPSYIRLGFVKLDDRLVDRSLRSQTTSTRQEPDSSTRPASSNLSDRTFAPSAPAPVSVTAPPTPTATATSTGSFHPRQENKGFSNLSRHSITVVPGSAGSSTSPLHHFHHPADAENWKRRQRVLGELNDLIQRRLMMTEKMRKVGTRGCVFGLV